jgi:hypothetical protein
LLYVFNNIIGILYGIQLSPGLSRFTPEGHAGRPIGSAGKPAGLPIRKGEPLRTVFAYYG